MMNDIIHVKNYKCIDQDGCKLGPFKQINVLIGKNNSGKSSIIEILKFLSKGDGSCGQSTRSNRQSTILIEHRITKEQLDILLDDPKKPYYANRGSNYGELLSYAGKTLGYMLTEKGEYTEFMLDGKEQKKYKRELLEYLAKVGHPCKDLKICHMGAERDIQPEMQKRIDALSQSGFGLTNLVQNFINREGFDHNLVEAIILEKFNQIAQPEINFARILAIGNVQDIWEINFQLIDGTRIPLSKMGSGVKTILHVLVMLYLIPKHDGKALVDYIFAFEELENNLHPAMQRKLYDFLYTFALDNCCQLFLTTHSHVGIDFFSSKGEAQILHVRNTDNSAKINIIDSSEGLNDILDDLDVRASDILQSNGIIWVEGPSDCTYINKWLSLIDPALVEGLHYSIMFYGGRLLSNLKLDYDQINKDLIPLLRLNRNAFVVLDRDGTSINRKLNTTKVRIVNEIGNNSYWITSGREIENYLSPRTITKWLNFKKQAIAKEFVHSKDSKIQESILLASPATKIDYAKIKNKYAREIRDFIDVGDLGELDLKTNLNNLADLIRSWNRL